jgi:hypothetical protein
MNNRHHGCRAAGQQESDECEVLHAPHCTALLAGASVNSFATAGRPMTEPYKTDFDGPDECDYIASS